MFLTSNMVPSGGNSVTTTSFANKYTMSASQDAVSEPVDSIVTLSGALTASTFKTMLNITGTSGKIPVLGLKTNDATARVISLRITIDSAYVTTITSSSITTSGNGIWAAGSRAASAGWIVDGEPLKFKTSCLVEIASSLTETDKISLFYKRFSES